MTTVNKGHRCNKALDTFQLTVVGEPALQADTLFLELLQRTLTNPHCPGDGHASPIPQGGTTEGGNSNG